MRKFNLYFDDIKYTLNGENNVWFTNPAGLGADYSPSMVDLRNGFFKPITTDIIPQNPIVGDITFTRVTDVLPYGDPYALYRDFSFRVSQAEKIEFAYQPYGTDEFRCEVKLEYITKTEKSGNWLTCPISFMPLTPWYLPVDVEVELISEIGALAKTIVPLGDIPSAIELTLTGGSMPAGISGSTASEALGGVTFRPSQTITEPGTLVYSTKYNDSFATFTADSDGTVTDLVSLDGWPNPFLRLKPFETNLIFVPYYDEDILPSILPTSTKLKLYYYYRSV